MFKYEKPFMEVVEFENEVIICSLTQTSGVHQTGSIGVKESTGSVIVNPEVQAITDTATGSDKLEG